MLTETAEVQARLDDAIARAVAAEAKVLELQNQFTTALQRAVCAEERAAAAERYLRSPSPPSRYGSDDGPTR